MLLPRAKDSWVELSTDTSTSHSSISDDEQLSQYISLIEDLPLDSVKVFQGITPAEFAEILDAIDEIPIRVKFIYLPESAELHVVSPSQLHESSLIHLSGIVDRFICNLHVPAGILSVKLNSEIRQPTRTIPDFICTLVHNPGDHAVKWAGEVCFVISPAATREKVKNLVADTPAIDLAFIIYIDEDQKWTAPDEEASAAIKLRSKGLISRSDFLKGFSHDEFYEKVDVEELTWASLKSVLFEVFLRHPVKGFDLESTDVAYTGRGTLYPTHEMDDVDRLFETGAQHLKTSVISLMRRNYGNPTSAQALKLQKIEDSDATLDIDWDEWLNLISQRLCCTAYDRYYEWFASLSPKHKTNLRDCGSSGSRQEQRG